MKDIFAITAAIAFLSESEYITREPQPRQPYKSNLTPTQKEKRAKKNKAQKASRKRNR